MNVPPSGAIISPRATVVRSMVTAGLAYSRYLPELRYDFWYACAYCSTSEAEAQAVGFQIDHYEPQTTGSPHVHDYDNLLYACQPCNIFKSDWWMSDEERAEGLRFVRPDWDDLSEHYSLIGDTLVPKTLPGSFTDGILRLNRQNLRYLRKQRRLLGDADDTIAAGLQTLAQMNIDSFPPAVRTRFARLRRELSELGNKAMNDDASGADIIRALNQSPMLATTPEELAAQRHEKRLRRQYLKGLKARVP